MIPTEKKMYDGEIDNIYVNGRLVFSKRENIMSEPIMQFFEYAHLPSELAIVSKQFHGLAHELVTNLPRNPERTVALRKLLEAKDAAVRAKIFKENAADTRPDPPPVRQPGA
jgi:hypothetical protein